MPRKPDLLDKMCEHEILIYVGGLAFALACAGGVLLWLK